MIHALFFIMLAFQQVQNTDTKIQPKPCATLEISRPEPKWIVYKCFQGCSYSNDPNIHYNKHPICPTGWKLDWNGGDAAWCMEPRP